MERAWAQDTGNPLLGTQVSKPIPRADAFDTDHQPLSRGRNRLEKRFEALPSYSGAARYLAVLIHEVEVHDSCTQVEATIKLVLFRVEAPEVSSGGYWAAYPAPAYRDDMRGASISIKG
jgi:hypothetical protein